MTLLVLRGPDGSLTTRPLASLLEAERAALDARADAVERDLQDAVMTFGGHYHAGANQRMAPSPVRERCARLRQSIEQELPRNPFQRMFAELDRALMCFQSRQQGCPHDEARCGVPLRRGADAPLHLLQRGDRCLYKHGGDHDRGFYGTQQCHPQHNRGGVLQFR